VFHNRAGLPMDMFFWNGAEAGLPLYRIAPSINDACYFQRLAESGPLHIMRSVLADTIEDHACLISTGTCEELISWNDVGGLQPLQHKAVESTQGHTFRFRDAATRRLLMQHTLSDLVLRGCDDGSAEKNAESVESLRKTVSELEDEGESLRETLALELASLVSALHDLASNKSAALPSADWHVGAGADMDSLAPLRAAAGTFGQLSRLL